MAHWDLIFSRVLSYDKTSNLMDNNTLWANFYGAICFYVEQNGADPDDSQFSLMDNGNKTITITTWTYDFKQPSNDILQAYNVVDAQGAAVRKLQIDAIRARRQPGMTTSQRDAIATSKFVTGDMIFNKTSKRLEIFIDGSWQGIATVS